MSLTQSMIKSQPSSALFTLSFFYFWPINFDFALSPLTSSSRLNAVKFSTRSKKMSLLKNSMKFFRLGATARNMSTGTDLVLVDVNSKTGINPHYTNHYTYHRVAQSGNWMDSVTGNSINQATLELDSHHLHVYNTVPLDQDSRSMGYHSFLYPYRYWYQMYKKLCGINCRNLWYFTVF